jgi:hypothetical protein
VGRFAVGSLSPVSCECHTDWRASESRAARSAARDERASHHPPVATGDFPKVFAVFRGTVSLTFQTISLCVVQILRAPSATPPTVAGESPAHRGRACGEGWSVHDVNKRRGLGSLWEGAREGKGLSGVEKAKGESRKRTRSENAQDARTRGRQGVRLTVRGASIVGHPRKF